MILPTLLLSLSGLVLAQDDSGNAQVPLAPNKNDLVGTWVSQSQGVLTGPTFANPMNFSFTPSNVSGVAYSFTEDLHFEEAWYKFYSNGSQPNCIKAVLQWQHGTYQPFENGSILLNPIPSDGRQQIQDTCAAVSNLIQQFNSTVNFSTWEIRQDEVLGKELLLYAFDGQPEQPLYPYANPPIMLPTGILTANVTAGQTANSAFIQATVPMVLVAVITIFSSVALLMS